MNAGDGGTSFISTFRALSFLSLSVYRSPWGAGSRLCGLVPCGCAICHPLLHPELASPRVTLLPPYSSFPTNNHIDFVISFASKVVALMNVLAARGNKLLPTKKGIDPTLVH